MTDLVFLHIRFNAGLRGNLSKLGQLTNLQQLILDQSQVDGGVEQDALGGGGFAGVDVRGDTDVAVALDGGLAGHDQSPNAGAARGLELTRKGGREQRQSGF